MSKELQIFKHDQFGEVRVVMVNGEPWWVANDVCAMLDIANNRDALARLDDDEKGVALIDTPGGPQEMGIVNEAGLYNLILGSRKPEAKAVKRWVTHEVLPAIRKHGLYATPQTVEAMLADPDTTIKLLETIKAERERRLTLETRLEEARPKEIFADAVDASANSILIGDLAKLLRQNGINIGQNRLFARLREWGWLNSTGDRRNLPAQKGMERRFFELKERTIANPDGSIRTTLTPKVTGRGQIYFINLFLGRSQAGQAV